MTENQAKQKRNSLILIATLLLVAGIAGVWLYFFQESGDTVTVRVNGKVTAVYPLSEDRVEVIHTGKDGINRLVIQDGKTFVEEANCPDEVCANHRPIYRNGESIVCLPHRVMVTVEKSDAADQPDIVV